MLYLSFIHFRGSALDVTGEAFMYIHLLYCFFLKAQLDLIKIKALCTCCAYYLIRCQTPEMGARVYFEYKRAWIHEREDARR